jgi:FAD dependent oxidoreductase
MTEFFKPTKISRRNFLGATSITVTALLAGRGFAAGVAERRKVDVCIYGGTSGGVTAAAALARLGRSVLLIEPTRHLGGMTSGGLGWIDYGKPAAIGGLTKQFFDDIRAYYAGQKISSNGWSVEPHVAEEFFEKLIAKYKVEVVREARLSAVKTRHRRIQSITLDKAPVDPRGAPVGEPQEKNFLHVEAAIFIDCSYEGDLLAGAGVSHRTDREASDEFKESFAGISYAAPDTGVAGDHTKAARKTLRIDPYRRAGDAGSGLLPFISGGTLSREGRRDSAIQAFNFRLCLTKEDSLPIEAPANYDPMTYEIVRRYIDALESVQEPLVPGDLYFNLGRKLPYPQPRLLKITGLMRGKTDVNSGSGGISMDFVNGGAERYANASWAERAKIWRAHEDYQRGYFYFLRSDPRLPEWLSKEIAPWGLAKDEFTDSGGWPPQLYIREARRMVGSFVIHQNFCEHPESREDSVGMGSYALDSHLCRRVARDGAMIHEGGFYHGLTKPYPIPFGTIVPREDQCENLLVTFCVSSTHVAFASVRMEPPFMILGESAALAADQALQDGTSIQRVNLSRLRARLLDAGQIL